MASYRAKRLQIIDRVKKAFSADASLFTPGGGGVNENVASVPSGKGGIDFSKPLRCCRVFSQRPGGFYRVDGGRIIEWTGLFQ